MEGSPGHRRAADGRRRRDDRGRYAGELAGRFVFIRGMRPSDRRGRRCRGGAFGRRPGGRRAVSVIANALAAGAASTAAANATRRAAWGMLPGAPRRGWRDVCAECRENALGRNGFRRAIRAGDLTVGLAVGDADVIIGVTTRAPTAFMHAMAWAAPPAAPRGRRGIADCPECDGVPPVPGGRRRKWSGLQMRIARRYKCSQRFSAILSGSQRLSSRQKTAYPAGGRTADRPLRGRVVRAWLTRGRTTGQSIDLSINNS